MTIPFAPMYVNYQHQEHYVFALLAEPFPSSFNVKRGTDYEKEVFMKLEGSDHVGPMFLCYKTNDHKKEIVTIPARGSEFVRHGDRCVMCGASKESGG